MKLELTVVASPSGPAMEAQEFSADIAEGASGSVLLAELSRRLPGSTFRVGGRPFESLVAGTPPLISGAVVVTGSTLVPAATTRPTAGKPPALVLAVLTGPDAGAIFPIRRGTYRIGRGPVEISIRDPGISRHQATLDVGDRAITVIVAPGAAPLEAGGREVQRETIAVGQMLSFGATTATLKFLPAPMAEPLTVDDAPLRVSHPQGSLGGRWTLAATSMLPLLAGTTLAVVTGQWMFMAFASMSAVTAVVPLLGGRKRRRTFRAQLASAVEHDAMRRTAAAPSLADIVLRGLPPPAVHSGPAHDGDGVRLRVGTADQFANVALEPASAGFEPPMICGMPVVIDLKGGEELIVAGPGQPVNALIRAILMQLAVGGLRTVITGGPERLPVAARFLSGTVVTANVEALRAQLDRYPSALVVDAGGDTGIAEILDSFIATGRRRLIRCRPGTVEVEAPEDLDGGKVHLLQLECHEGGLFGKWGKLDFTPDLASHQTFDRFARRQATAASVRTESPAGIPDSCYFADLVGMTASAIARTWELNPAGRLMPVPLGLTAGAPLLLDLERDGPHLLVAGTTGSGKSELLRTLVAGLALRHPPSAVSFLFIDFKGGSGLGSLSALPHTTALVTDINGSGMDRVLASLRAEIRHREELFSRVPVQDLLHYIAEAPEAFPRLPHLVIVIDEFRILVDQVPNALAELMRIAAVGRSLGIHLVMATQRPQGAISADIRANITTSICLRVQSPFESQDVIGAAHAASIPVALPGRAYLRCGGDPPREFQAAVIRVNKPQETASLRIRPARAAFSDPPAAPLPTTQPSTARDDDLAAEVAELVTGVHNATGAPLPRAPVAPELPRVLDPAVFASAMAAMAGPISDQSPGVSLGLLDVPERQAVLPLFWDPWTQSHIALIGPPGGGAVSATRLAACGLLPVSGLNACLYCLDGDGSLSALAESPWVGAYLDPDDARATVRLLQRFVGILKDRSIGPNSDRGAGAVLHREVDARAAIHLEAEAGTGSVPDVEASWVTQRPLLVLVITSAGRWLSAFRSSPWPWAEDLLGDVVRDGHRAGVVLVVSGERELLASRLMAAIPNRLFFPKGASAESTIAWPKLPAVEAVPGRAVVVGPLADDTAGQASASGGHIAQLLWRPDDASAISSVTWPDMVPVIAPHKTTPDQTPPAHPEVRRPAPPFRIRALPDRVGVDAVLSAATARSSAPARASESSFRPARLLLGLGGDGLDAVTVRIDPGSTLLAIGAPGSGKTTLLGALPALNPDALNWLRPGPGASADDYWIELADSVFPKPSSRDAATKSSDEDAAMKSRDHEAAMLGALVDDLQTLSPAAQAALERLRTAGALVVATAPLIAAALMRLPLAMAGRNPGTGLVLAPNRPQDGDFFSCRLDTHGHAPPGRAVLLVNGSCEWLQLPWP